MLSPALLQTMKDYDPMRADMSNIETTLGWFTMSFIVKYHNYVTLSKYSCKTNSTDNVWFYLNTLPSGSVARSGSRPMDYIYQWLFSVVCILESRKKGHKSAEFVTFN